MKFVAHLRNYCNNCTVTGLRFIANPKLHVTERIFWFLAVLCSGLGAAYMIKDFFESFQKQTISIAFDAFGANEPLEFPAIGLCTYNVIGEILDRIGPYLSQYGKDPRGKYNFPVENYILFLLQPYKYHDKFLATHCSSSEKCQNCSKCSSVNTHDALTLFDLTCDEFFFSCKFGGRPFDCCKYFMPLFTEQSKCFVLNSIQNNIRDGPNWFNTKRTIGDASIKMEILMKTQFTAFLLSPEDVPIFSTPRLSVTDFNEAREMRFQMKTTRNDEFVRKVPPKYRKCKFTDENDPNSSFKYHSFSVCAHDCIRDYQLKNCNCTLFYYNPFNISKFPICDFKGNLCLEEKYSLRVDLKSILYSHTIPGHYCHCWPSCEEALIESIYDVVSYPLPEPVPFDGMRGINISSVDRQFIAFNRKTLIDFLQVIVIVGGILGLFLGASLLSAFEIIFYFTLALIDACFFKGESKTQDQKGEKEKGPPIHYNKDTKVYLYS